MGWDHLRVIYLSKARWIAGRVAPFQRATRRPRGGRRAATARPTFEPRPSACWSTLLRFHQHLPRPGRTNRFDTTEKISWIQLNPTKNFKFTTRDISWLQVALISQWRVLVNNYFQWLEIYKKTGMKFPELFFEWYRGGKWRFLEWGSIKKGMKWRKSNHQIIFSWN